jgi:hypothetical protein
LAQVMEKWRLLWRQQWTFVCPKKRGISCVAKKLFAFKHDSASWSYAGGNIQRHSKLSIRSINMTFTSRLGKLLRFLPIANAVFYVSQYRL